MAMSMHAVVGARIVLWWVPVVIRFAVHLRETSPPMRPEEDELGKPQEINAE